MAQFSNPIIATNGLIFYYDLNNVTKSFVGPPITNHVTDPATMTGWTNYWNTQAASTFTTEFGTTGYRFSSQPSWNGIYKLLTVPSTGTYTFSGWVRYWGGSVNNNGATVYVSGWGGADSNVGINKALIGQWQRISITLNCTNTSFYLYFISFGGTSDGLSDHSTWEITMPQIESGSSATPFVNGARSTSQTILDLTRQRSITVVGSPTYGNSKITIPNSNSIYLDVGNPTSLRMGSQDFTLSYWIKQLDNGTNVLLEARGTSLAGYLLALNYPSTGQISMQLNTVSTGYQYVSSISTLGFNTVQNIVTVVNRAQSSIFLYLNGVLWNTITGLHSNSISPASSDIYRIGYDLGGTTANYELYAQSHYNRALTATEVLRNFNIHKGRYGL
jgi:hypothetical protein